MEPDIQRVVDRVVVRGDIAGVLDAARLASRDAANLREVYQPLSIQLGEYAKVTSETGPLNELNSKLGEAMEIDMTGLQMGQLAPPAPEGPPPSDPEQEAKAEKARQEIEAKAAAGQQKMALAEAEHGQGLRHKGEAHAVDILTRLAKLDMARQAAVRKRKAG